MKQVNVIRRRRSWEWQVRDEDGRVLMGGRERTRPAARYQSYRILFMLLANSWRLDDVRVLDQPADPVPRNRRSAV